MNSSFYIKNATQLEKIGKRDEAIAMYRKAIEVNPTFSWYYHCLGELLIKNKCYAEAIVYLSRACEINPNSAFHNYMLIKVLSLKNRLSSYEAMPLLRNPIIYPKMPGLSNEASTNINGPSLIRVPDWIENPLGRYYLYFAHHKGSYIRLAYADRIEGPYTVYEPGTLRLNQTVCRSHIASPDVHIDEDTQEIRMYFHGDSSDRKGQHTFLAKSSDGLHFTSLPEVLGPFYFRVFYYGGYYYAIAMSAVPTVSSVLLRSKEGTTNWERGKNIIANCRHTAVLLSGETLTIFFTRIGDSPESILSSKINLTQNFLHWEASEPILVKQPSYDYEGASLPVQPSKAGIAETFVRQLRDPAIFQEKDKIYLLYTVGGESGIAISELVSSDP
jgi:hypothetical protein